LPGPGCYGSGGDWRGSARRGVAFRSSAVNTAIRPADWLVGFMYLLPPINKPDLRLFRSRIGNGRRFFRKCIGFAAQAALLDQTVN